MEHTFLLRQGSWTARGTYTDDRGRELPLEGRSEIRHGPDAWQNRSVMIIASNVGPVEFRNDYVVEPIVAGESATSWTSTNPALGALLGRFAFVDDVILSTYQSEDDRVRGVESMRRVDEDRYEARGALFEGRRRVSSWAAMLERDRSRE